MNPCPCHMEAKRRDLRNPWGPYYSPYQGPYHNSIQDESGDVSGNVLGGGGDAASAAESFYGSAVTSQKSKTEVGALSLLRPMSSARVRLGQKKLEFLDMEQEPLYPESFPVNSTHRGGTPGTQPHPTSDPNDDEDSATMVSRHKLLNIFLETYHF